MIAQNTGVSNLAQCVFLFVRIGRKGREVGKEHLVFFCGVSACVWCVCDFVENVLRQSGTAFVVEVTMVVIRDYFLYVFFLPQD